MWWRDVNNRSQQLWRRELNRMQRDMERLSRNVSRPTAPSFPALNVWSNADGLLITAEIPGIEPDDIDISIVGDTLTLKGARNPEDLGEDVTYHRRERGCGQFNRTLQLPYRIETSDVQATFDKGVLTIDLPRAEVDKPKKIQVKVA